jgi:DNA-binding transcriptional MerR regulator
MSEFLTAYSIKEVSEKVDVPPGTLRQWESDFKGILDIPRDKENSRYYTDIEIETLSHIKKMREKNLSKAVIKELLDKQPAAELEKVPQPPVPVLRQSEITETFRNIQNSFETFPEIKEMIVSEIKNDIRNEIKNEITATIQKEISQGMESTSEQIKSLSDAYKSEVERRDELLTENMKLLRELKEEKSKSFFSKLFKR